MNWNPQQPPFPQQTFPGQTAPQQQPAPGFGQGYPQQQPAPGFGQGYPQGAPQGQPPFQGQAPGFGQGYPQQLPQNQPRHTQQGPQVDLDSAGDDDAEYPKLHAAGGQPWLLTFVSATEKTSFYEPGSTIFWIVADVRASADPAFTAGMRVSIKVGGLGHPTKNNKAQARLKSFLSACTREPVSGQYPPGHWAGRKAQALGGQLAGAPFACIIANKLSNNIDPQTGMKRPYLVPSFLQG